MNVKDEMDRSVHNSHLFILRLWLENMGNGQTDWRGKIQHVNSGEARYFRDWATVEAFVEELLHRIDQKESDTCKDEETDRLSPGI
jgi:hypothetical protein